MKIIRTSLLAAVNPHCRSVHSTKIPYKSQYVKANGMTVRCIELPGKITEETVALTQMLRTESHPEFILIQGSIQY
jgi:hypothetical protein